MNYFPAAHHAARHCPAAGNEADGAHAGNAAVGQGLVHGGLEALKIDSRIHLGVMRGWCGARLGHT